MSLIDGIVADTRVRLAERMRQRPEGELRAMINDAPRAKISFREAIRQPPFRLIAEIKRRSPSSGWMDGANVDAALRVYHDTPSVAAVSILTDQDHFGGSLEELWRARSATDKPILRKDFILDEYQVLEARAFGADAVLIMSGLHAADPQKAARLVSTAKSLGMDVLFELGMTRDAVDAQRVLILDDDVVWGINSRRFETSALRAMSRLGSLIGSELSVKTSVHAELVHRVPVGQPAVAESGISDPGYLHNLRDLGYCAALIGTAFLKKGTNVAQVVPTYDREISGMIGQRHEAGRTLGSRSPVPTG